MTFIDLVFYLFIFVVFIQVVFNIFFFGKFAFLKHQETVSKNFPISVIICAKNEMENLQNFLPSIISQDYPQFEIILINDASRDKTQKLMESFAKKNKNIRIVNVKNTEAFWGNKKYALTLGIKVSKYDCLLFTDADCEPVSPHWISEMSSHFNDTKTIVLGYGAYKTVKKSILNKLIRFETLLTAINCFSFAKIGLPYMGVGRNLAYKKSEFFNANGYVNHMKIRSGDDDLFINQVATSNNTAICFSQNSFTMSIPETKFKTWFNQKRRHISTANHYKLKHKILLATLYTSQLLFWVLAIILLTVTFKWKIVLTLVLLRICIQYITIGYSTKKLGEKDTLLMIPFLEIFLIIMQLSIFITNLISKPNHWK